jgi:isopentenyl-diphosphate delta-isomerase
MTGGHENTTEINRALARAASSLASRWGSEASELASNTTTSVLKSYTAVRDAAPDAFIYGNLGAAQLREYDIETVERAVEMIEADASAVHLNLLQEAAQPEGDVDGLQYSPILQDGRRSPRVVP